MSWVISCRYWVPSSQSWVLGIWVLGTALGYPGVCVLSLGSSVVGIGSLVLSPGCLVLGYPGICLSLYLPVVNSFVCHPSLQVYEEIADHFSATRHKPWPRIAEFLLAQQVGSILLDIGCGNGKYFDVNSHLCQVAARCFHWVVVSRDVYWLCCFGANPRLFQLLLLKNELLLWSTIVSLHVLHCFVAVVFFVCLLFFFVAMVLVLMDLSFAGRQFVVLLFFLIVVAVLYAVCSAAWWLFACVMFDGCCLV